MKNIAVVQKWRGILKECRTSKTQKRAQRHFIKAS